jgi:hypothetical protein
MYTIDEAVAFNFRAHQQQAYRRHSAMVDISMQTLSDSIAHYSVKSDPASTSTNNNVPRTVVTTRLTHCGGQTVSALATICMGRLYKWRMSNGNRVDGLPRLMHTGTRI